MELLSCFLKTLFLGLRLAFRIRFVWPWCLLVVYGNSMPVYLQRFVCVFGFALHPLWVNSLHISGPLEKQTQAIIWPSLGEWKLLSVWSVYLCPCTHWTNTATFNQNLRTTWYQGPLQSSHQVWSESDEWWRTDSDVHPGFSDLWQINSFQHVKRISCSVSHFFPSLILIFLFVSVVPLPRLLALDHFSQFSLHFSRPH